MFHFLDTPGRAPKKAILSFTWMCRQPLRNLFPQRNNLGTIFATNWLSHGGYYSGLAAELSGTCRRSQLSSLIRHRFFCKPFLVAWPLLLSNGLSTCSTPNSSELKEYRTFYSPSSSSTPKPLYLREFRNISQRIACLVFSSIPH